MNISKQIISLLFCVSLLPFLGYAQTKSVVTGCEDGIHKMDEALYRIVNKPEKFLAVVLRPNKKEKAKVLKVRSATIEKHCETRGLKNRCLVTIGKAAKDLGAAEIYVEGELVETLYYDKNAVSFCTEP